MTTNLPYKSLDLSTPDITALLENAPIYRKSAVVTAVRVDVETPVTTTLTRESGSFDETENVAQPGDWIVTNPTGEQYVIPHETFVKRYVPEGVDGQYRAKGEARIIANPTGVAIKILAPWGEEQFGDADCLVASAVDPDDRDAVGADRYIIGSKEFETTYDQHPIGPLTHNRTEPHEETVQVTSKPSGDLSL